MIHSWKLKNFKSIKTSMKQMEFGNVTIIAGANSSGKSTLIQSILLLAQTLANREDYNPLLLNGELVSLGTVSDVWNSGNVEQPLIIDFLVDVPNHETATLQIVLELLPDQADPSNTQVKIQKARYAWSESGIEKHLFDELLGIRFFKHEDSDYQIFEETPVLIEQWNSELAWNRIEPIVSRLGTSIKMQDFLPDEFLYTASRETDGFTPRNLMIRPLEDVNAYYHQGIQIPLEIVDLLYQAIDEYNSNFKVYEEQIHLLPERQRGQKFHHTDYVNMIEHLTAKQIRYLIDFFDRHLEFEIDRTDAWHESEFTKKVSAATNEFFVDRIRYIGANRVRPTALFDYRPHDILSDVGTDGHNVASALAEHKDKKVRYWHPTTKSIKKSTLLEIVEIWLNYFELVDRLDPEKRGKLGTFLSLKADGMDKPLDLSSVGFGVSQILPIIVQGLLCSQGSVFIVEQPEVHLHPKLQSRLAYFFYALSLVGVQCIIETHSEHIVNQFRLLVASEEDLSVHSNRLHENVRIYFAAKDRKKGTVFTDVKIDAAGMIVDWPKDFMDEGSRLAEEILRAAEKRAKVRQ